MEADERALVQRVLSGAEGAGDEFVGRYRGRIHAVSVAILGWRDPEAEDVVQETFVAALASLASFEFRSSIYTWLNQICVRQCYRRIRSRSRMALGSERDLAETLGATAAEEENALPALEEGRKQWLKKAVETMEPGCKDLVMARDFQGMSYGDLSRMLKAPIGTVMSRLSRCREKLRIMAKTWLEGDGHA
jgi:RNA polymerase sigma factor (sigma-70 family)